MTDTKALALLRTAYTDLLALTGSLDDESGWRPTGCAGWTARDLVFHLLGDAQRALVAFGTPAEGPPDVDAVSYWGNWRPGTEEAARNRRNTRIMACVWSDIRPLAELYRETACAVLVQAERLDGDELLGTQGHVITADDLVTTLAVEAAVHHLDLIAHHPGPGPAPSSLRAVRDTLDGLLGRTTGEEWEDVRYVLVGTGRAEPSAAERALLGRESLRLPLFG
ncbi:maleylpyruvate isomerase N-terminal domain-containing protein [Streptomyces orinoci]|uniref:Maleylpyruvate isomerase N-terminal domain-containing protein n=1 Tax=Streptomyces orinoci TaxID=67339 RepID=A0ABV3JTV4_STRON|nr:maleylpyruvate isomerase N-terminal domain-containing protein [Streptomyces orinoci]